MDYKKLNSSTINDKYEQVVNLDEHTKKDILNIGINPDILLEMQNGELDKNSFGVIYNYLATNGSAHAQQASNDLSLLAITASITVFFMGLTATIHFNPYTYAILGFGLIFIFYHFLKEIRYEKEEARANYRVQEWLAKEYRIILPWDPDETPTYKMKKRKDSLK